jgi:hypothetical protein
MKRILDEATIRGIVRQRLIGRMLTEVDGTPDGPTLNLGGVMSLFGLGGTEASPQGAAASDTFDSGRKRGESAAGAIARIIGSNADIDQGTRAEYIGEKLGQAIIDFIEKMEYIERPFVPTDPAGVLQEWQRAVENGEVPKVAEFTMTADGDGLVRYITAIAAAEYGLHLTIQNMDNTQSYYQANLKDKVDTIHTAIDGSTSMEGPESLSQVMTIVREVLKGDDENLIHTRLLLAGFAQQNSTVGELAKPIGLTVLTLAAIVAVVYTGGALLGAGGVSAGGVGAGGVGAGGVGAGSGVMASGVALLGKLPAMAAATTFVGTAGVAVTAGAAALGVAAACVTAWSVTPAYESALEAYEGTPTALLISAINDENMSPLDELAGEVADTWFSTSLKDADRRDRMAATLMMITQPDASKQQIMQKFKDVLN